MLGQRASSTASRTDSRIFVYEISGLSQNELTARQKSPIRSSQNQIFQVPFHRMSEEMRRITLLGGEIINISLLNINNPDSSSEDLTENNSSDVAETTAN